MSVPFASIFTDIPHEILLFFHNQAGFGWGLAIVALTFTVRLAILPLSIKQIRGMRALQELQPQLKAIQERHKDDRPRQQQEMMKFYQENEINPLASCWPLLLQIPVFLALFALLRGDAFRADVISSGPASQGWLGVDSLIENPGGVELGVLMALFVVTQLFAGLAMSIRGPGLEGPQKFIIFALPFAFAPFVATFPAGLSIYWIATNIWTLGQQQVVLTLLPHPPKPTEEELAALSAKPPPPPPRRKKKKRK